LQENVDRKGGTNFLAVVSKVDYFFVIICLLTIFLFFYGLGNRPFWQDEAETACLARNVLKFGLPQAYDGVNLISQQEGLDFGPNGYLWRWAPWLQIYLTALSFKLWGMSTVAGRLPFALAGAACVALIYAMIKKYFNDLSWARLSSLFLALSVPFILHSRQCRYYALGAFFVLLCIYVFRAKWQTRALPAAIFISALVLLFHTNYLLFFSFSFSLSLAAIIFYRDKLPLARSIVLTLIVFVLVFPCVFMFSLSQQSGFLNHPGAFLRANIRDLFAFMIPLPIFLVVMWRLIQSIIRKIGGSSMGADERFVLFLSLVIILNIALLSLTPWRFHRYLIHLYPLSSIVLGWVAVRLFRYQKLSGVLLIMLIGFTNWLHIPPLEWVRFIDRPRHNDFQMLTYTGIPLKLYLSEIFTDYPDVNQSLIHYFLKNARPGDTIVTTYGDLPLMFYTPFYVLGGLQGRVPDRDHIPEWIVKRTHTVTNGKGELLKSEMYVSDQIWLDERYDRIVLSLPDEQFGNNPDPFHHRFIPLSDFYVPLTIYKKKN
jgi:hypothetical protein